MYGLSAGDVRCRVTLMSGAPVCHFSVSEVVDNMTILQFKDIAQKSNIPSHEQKLIFNGQVLAGTEVVPFAGLEPGAAVSVTLVREEPTFLLRNHWNTHSNGGRCGKVLSLDYQGDNFCTLSLKSFPEVLPEVLPWQLMAVPPEHPDSGDGRYYVVHSSGRILGLSGDRLCLADPWDQDVYNECYVPWEFVRLPHNHPFSSDMRHYIINRQGESDGNVQAGRMVGYGGQSVVLEERWRGGPHTYDMVPWECITADGAIDPSGSEGIALILQNFWNTRTNSGRCGKVIGSTLDFDGALCELNSAPVELLARLPWRAIAVPPQHPGSGESRYYMVHESGRVLSFDSGTRNLCCGDRWDSGTHKESYIAWEFYQVPADHPFHDAMRYYIINRSAGDRAGQMVGYAGNSVILEEYWQGGAHAYDMVPWELVTSNGNISISQAGGVSTGCTIAT